MKGWFLVFLSGTILFTGCAHYQAQPISPEKTAARLEARRLDDPELKKFLEQESGHPLTNWPKKSWDLRELTLAAFNFHPSLGVARAQWLAASASIETARGRPNPSVGVQPGWDSQIPGTFSPWIVTATFDVPIETAGKRQKRIALAQKNVESARWSFVSAAWQIRAGVRAALLDYKIAARRAELLEKQFVPLKRIQQLLQQRFEAGEISRPEVTVALITLNKTQHDLGEARAAEADARARLAAAMGLSAAALDGEELDFDFSTHDAGALTSSEARRLALQLRADVRAALADYAAAEADLRLEVAKQYPDLHLGPGYAWNTGSAGDNEWILGATLELPILNQNQGPIAEAQARRRLAAARFVALQSEIIGDIDRAVAAFGVASGQLRTGDELLAVEQKQQQAAEAQIKAGAGERLDLLAAEVEVSNAALTQLDNEAKVQVALGQLEDALQRPSDSIASAIEHISK